ncbi:hypothetical protein CGRA01v4_01238 [Colletotrichum graminicola]|nr:hypothetical protein CGRA01v4_01238 [Colletotrichum graminicola]
MQGEEVKEEYVPRAPKSLARPRLPQPGLSTCATNGNGSRNRI